MKANIEKLQAGGYIAYQPTPMIPQQQAPATGATTVAEQKKEEEDYLDKDIIGKMLGKGITTDVMDYSQKLQSAYQQYQQMSDLQRNSYKGRQIRQMLKGDLGELNALMRSKDAFDGAIANAKSNEALDEVAVTSQGVVARSAETGKIDVIGFAEYAKNKDKYAVLTNAQLAEQREYNKDLLKNTSTFSILNFGKGMTKIQEEVYKIASKLGNTSKSASNGEYGAPTETQENIQHLQQAAQQGLFKIKNGESSSTNAPQIQMAQRALWENLSDNSKAVLKARAAREVSDPSKINERAFQMMSDLLNPSLEVSSSITYDQSASKGKGSGAGKEAKTEGWGPYGMAFSMANDTIPLSQIGTQKVRIDGFASAIPTEAYTSKDNTRIPLTNASKLNNVSYISKAFVANGDKVNPNTTVITGDAYVTELPYTQDENGNLKIDEAGSKRYAQYMDAKRRQPNITAQAEAALKAQYGVENFRTGKFVVAEAASYTDHFFDHRDSNYYDKLSGPEKDALGELVDPKSDTVRDGLDNDAYKHLIFIPAKQLATWNAMDGHQAQIPKELYNIQAGYNRGNDGSIGRGGTSYDTNATGGLSKDEYFNK